MTDGTKKLAGQHRSEIARLKKQIQEQDRKIERLKAELAKGPSTTRTPAAPEAPGPEGVPDGFRYSVRSLKSQRTRLKLSAADYSKLLGVSMQTVYNWEQGKARPRDSQMAAIVELRGMGRREALAKLDELGGVAPKKARSARRKIAQNARRARTTASAKSVAAPGKPAARASKGKKAKATKTPSRKKRKAARKA